MPESLNIVNFDTVSNKLLLTCTYTCNQSKIQ